MIAVLQRVKRAAVTADGVPTGEIGVGLMILLGVLSGDTEADARLLAEKIAKLRIFSDENDKMNLSVTDIGGGAHFQFHPGRKLRQGKSPRLSECGASFGGGSSISALYRASR